MKRSNTGGYLGTFVLSCLFTSNIVFADMDSALNALERGDKDQAITLFKASSTDAMAQLYLAKIYLDRDLDEAEKWIDKALEQQPENAEMHYMLGLIKGYQAQDAIFSALSLAKKSKAAFEKAVQLEPDSVEYLLGLFRFHINAPSVAGGDLEEAAKLSARLTLLDPLEGLQAKIDVAYSNEDDDLVESLITRGLKEHQNAPSLAYQAGMIYLRSEDYPQAFKYLEIASRERKPDASPSSKEKMDADIVRFSAMYQFGRSAVLSESNQQAGIVAFEAFIADAPIHEALPEKDWASFRLGELYEQSGNKEKAKSLYKSVAKTQDKHLKKKVRRKL